MSPRPGRGEATVTFLGGVGTVTGSRFLVETGRAAVLVECGLFQGLRELRRRNWDAPSVERLDAVVITNAHLDHCGYLPVFARHGFSGPVYATEHTIELAEIALREGARLLAEDAEQANRYGWTRHHPALPLYDEFEVERVLRLFRVLPYEQPVPVAPGVAVSVHPAGHILGSAWLQVYLDEPGGERTLVVSGALGRPRHPLLAPPELPGAAEAVIVESTYGDRRHEDDEAVERLAEAVSRTVARGGSVVIPASAVDRTEVILYTLRELVGTGQVPEVPVVVDGPSMLAALDVYRRAIAARSAELHPGLVARGESFAPGMLRELQTVEESMLANAPRVPSVIVSASGMATGGRVLHHLRHLLPDPRNTVVIAGFAAAGTRARDLLEGAPAIKMHGRYVPVRAEVVEVPVAHADAEEILGWLRAMPAPRMTYVVHGEPGASARLRDRIAADLGWPAVVPRLGERVLFA
ncbi:MBL fold metallo-hydrolase [Carbonactinospora thermoautotrophica]|uniref:MBL fold metallo-hydrolase RNA specificity domain-containing protein n=1 Tax=Carbonactinospora thermoautotrophica TaxID=1469144 RepID=UPI00226F4F50|nr:MBL fold metallo-hydrolase [Carbonactinospora thermoautotrophica]MCX9191392.1 MBL fold metallo-hydrolase [Carbonactinospora thermoautotrophica]